MCIRDSVYTIFPDMRNKLMEKDGQNIKLESLKSPELLIKINNINLNVLIDTGSAINALSENWYTNNQIKLGKHEILSVNNTTIISAIGNKSKHIRKQIFCEVNINNSLSLVRECLLGMNFLKQAGGIINIPKE